MFATCPLPFNFLPFIGQAIELKPYLPILDTTAQKLLRWAGWSLLCALFILFGFYRHYTGNPSRNILVSIFLFLACSALLLAAGYCWYWALFRYRVYAPEMWKMRLPDGRIVTHAWVRSQDYTNGMVLMYPTMILRRSCSFWGSTLEGISLEIPFEVVLQAYDVNLLAQSRAGVEERLLEALRGVIARKLKQHTFRSACTSSLLDHIIGEVTFNRVNRFYASYGVRLLSIYFHEPCPRYPNMITSKGVSNMNELVPYSYQTPTNARSFANEMRLPQLFDADLIKAEMQRMHERGLLGQFVYVLFEKYKSKQEQNLIKIWAEKISSLGVLAKSIQSVQQIYAENQIRMAEREIEFDRIEAEKEHHRADRAKAVLEQVRAVAEMNRLMSPKAGSKQENSDFYRSFVDRAVSSHEKATQAIQEIQKSNLPQDTKERLREVIEQRLFEDVNRNHCRPIVFQVDSLVC